MGAPVRFDARLRPTCSLRPVVITWDLCVFAVHPIGGGGPVSYLMRDGTEVAEFLDQLDAGLLDEELSELVRRPPRRRLRRRQAVRRAASVGVEHEFIVRDDRGHPVDFREVLPGLVFDGVSADPSDPNAVRCAWGGVVTADGPEAEIATPPVPIGEGFVADVVAAAELGRGALAASLPVSWSLEGFSTHVNVTFRNRRVDHRHAELLARSVGPAVMLLMDRADSPGLLVRPRPGRMEFCGEYVVGEELAAVVAFVGAAVTGLDEGVLSPKLLDRLAIDLRLEPACERFGWYVDRCSVGFDLGERGPASELVRRDGACVTGHAHVRELWAVVRPALAARVSPEDLAAMDRAAHEPRSRLREPPQTGVASSS
jgi:hypothetical protein